LRAIRVGLVGCGRIGGRHAAALAEMPGVELVAVCDRLKERAESLAREFGAIVWDDGDSLIRSKEVEALIIATPSGLHHEQARDGLAHGKHVLVEKPLALSLEGASEVAEAARASGRILAVVHPLRFVPTVRWVGALVEDGRFGKLSHVSCEVRLNRDQDYYDGSAWRGSRRLDGGILLNQAVHHLDVLCWLLGEPLWVQGFTATRLHDTEIEDLATGVALFENGVPATLEVTTNCYGGNLEERLVVLGQKGLALLGGKGLHDVEECRLEGDASDAVNTVPLANEREVSAPHRAVLEDFFHAIRSGEAPAVDAADAMKSLRLALAIYRSAEAGRRIEASQV